MTNRDVGHTRELNPNIMTNQWQNAWGLERDDGWATTADQPNMTQPLVQPYINKQIESEIKKGHQKEVKHQKKTSSGKRLIREHGNVPATQVECPKDLSKISCGTHCYKDGHLMAVDCSGQKNKDKANKRKQKTPSLTVPPNYPSQVTVTPPTGEEPYPETDEQDVGGPQPGATTPQTNPDWEVTPSPGQEQQLPTIPPGSPGQAPTPSAPPQKVITTPPTPIQGVPPPTSCAAVGQSSPDQNSGFTNGCGKGNDSWISCRAGIGTGPNGNPTKESGSQKIPVSTLIKNSQHFYVIYHFITQNQTSGGPVGAEVTGGYCGSNNNVPQVGITIGINGKGQIIRRTEDHYKKGRDVPGDYNELTSDGTSGPGFVGRIPELPNLDHKDFYIVWCADKDGSTVTYRGYIRLGGREYQVANLVNPREGGGVSDGKHHDSRTKIIDFTEAGHNTYLRGRHNNNN